MAKIHLISSWNALDGVAIHGELITEGLRKLGHKVIVFAPANYEIKQPIFYEKTIFEKNLFSAFSFLREGNQYSGEEKFLEYLYLDERIIKGKPDFIIIEKPTSIPLEKLASLLQTFKRKNKKPKLIGIIHEGDLPRRKVFFRFPWDKLIVFDERFKKLFSPFFGTKIKVVPFPFYCPSFKGKKDEVAPSSNEEKKILVVTSIGGRRSEEKNKIKELCQKFKKSKKGVIFNFLTARIEDVDFFLKLKKEFSFVNMIFSRFHFSSSSFQNIILSSTAILFLKESSPKYLVVSSMMAIIAGFLKPIIVPDNAFFYGFTEEVVKYKNISEIEEKLAEALRLKDKIRKKIEILVNKNSPSQVAKKIIS